MSEENKKVIEDLLNINPRNMSYEQLISMQNGWWETLNLLSEQNKENKQLKYQLQQKENIIKEVREKIHDIWFKIDFSNMTSMSYVTIKLDETSQGNELLEILDKEDKQ